ncbi:CPBP family intramembrane metalloprotease [candidate division FCPU426 bacterium]|nr:CPBP family intramembrane metalloprotease [candidate division FCPU426 bacterium]
MRLSPPFILRRLGADALFILLLLAAGWIPAFTFRGWNWDLGWDVSGQAAWALAGLSLGPGLAALAAVLFSAGDWRPALSAQKGILYYLLPAWFLLPLLGALAGAISVFCGFTEWDWYLGAAHHHLILRLQADAGSTAASAPNPWFFWLGMWFFGPLLWFLPAWLEEIAWRGCLYHRLRHHHFWTIALSAGLLWWLWKLPLFFQGYLYADRTLLAPFLGLIYALETSILFTWLRQASGSVLAPAIARATLYSSALVAQSFTDLTNPLFAHLPGVTGLALLGVFILAGARWGGFQKQPDAAKKNPDRVLQS